MIEHRHSNCPNLIFRASLPPHVIEAPGDGNDLMWIESQMSAIRALFDLAALRIIISSLFYYIFYFYYLIFT